MGWFNHDDEMDFQYKKISDSYLKELNEEFLAGYKYGIQEYAGSWEGKNWKDDLERFERALQKYDRIGFIADARNLGIYFGKFYAILKSDLIYTVIADDKAVGMITEIIEGLKKIRTFNLKIIKKRISTSTEF